MIFIPIGIIIKVLDLEKSIEWITPRWVYIDVVLDGIITKLQCFIFRIKIVMNRVPFCTIISILSLKYYVCTLIDLLVGLF